MILTYIHNVPVPSKGASTVQVMRMCAALARHGCDVELLVPQSKEGPEPSLPDTFQYYDCPEIFKIRRLKLPISGGIPYALAAVRYAVRRKSDFVYARCIRSSALAALAGLPVAHEAHGPLEAYSRSGQMAFKWLAGARNFKRLVTINGALADYYSEKFPQLAHVPHVAPSGTDPVEIEEGQPAQRKDRLRVGYVGSLFPGKGMELISQLARQTDHHFIVAGGDDASIARWGAETGENVEFLGHIANREVSDLIQSFDVALAPYLETVGGMNVTFNLARWMSPLKLFEYMAHGKTILVSDLPSIREVVQDGQEVLLCSPSDAGDWAIALERLAEDPQLRDRLGNSALQSFLKHFTWDQRTVGILKAIAV